MVRKLHDFVRIIILVLFLSWAEFLVLAQNNCEKTTFVCEYEKALKSPNCVELLYLENKNIDEDTMLQFINLKKIYLVNCNADAFIKYAWKFDKLEIISIQYNVNEIPESIGQCKSLRQLIIFNSKIRIIPKSISKLDSLKTFHINYSLIKTVPKELFKLQGLKNLILLWGEGETNLSKEQQLIIKNNLPNCKCIF